MSTNTKTLSRAALLLAMAVVFQTIKVGGQYFTGTGVNAVLLIAVSVCGLGWAIAIGSLTPLLAIALGVLKQPVFIIVPFIIAGNILYVSLYHLTKRFSNYLGVAFAAASKFALLYIAVSYLLKVPPQLKVVFGLPQLYTALMGGALAMLAMKALSKVNS